MGFWLVEKIAGRVVGTFLLTAGVVCSEMVEPPDLIIAVDELAPMGTAWIEKLDRARLLSVMQLVGLKESRSPIRVIFAAESSELARRTPHWISGFADTENEAIVLFPDRTPTYPHDSIDTLLQHEVAHILIARAAKGRSIPRWFNEGLAMAAERTWAFEDRTRLAWGIVWGGHVSIAELSELFEGNRQAIARAYGLSGAFVHDLLRTYGSDLAARILSLVARDWSFENAFYETTGDPLVWAEDRFWTRQRLWERWVPILTRPFVLWMGVTLLALYAIFMHRQKRAAQRQKWNEEDELERSLRWKPKEGEPTLH